MVCFLLCVQKFKLYQNARVQQSNGFAKRQRVIAFMPASFEGGEPFGWFGFVNHFKCKNSQVRAGKHNLSDGQGWQRL
jgi:hypothetical protein